MNELSSHGCIHRGAFLGWGSGASASGCPSGWMPRLASFLVRRHAVGFVGGMAACDTSASAFHRHSVGLVYSKTG